jgi:hypothetical protein
MGLDSIRVIVNYLYTIYSNYFPPVGLVQRPSPKMKKWPCFRQSNPGTPLVLGIFGPDWFDSGLETGPQSTICNLYGELGFPQKKPIVLLGDNDGSISMTKNPQFHKRTKHVDLRWHWIRDLVNNGRINVVDCRNPQQTADIMTKPLPRPKFGQHVNELGLSDAYAV